jgi:uncharacterized membrane protein
LKIIILIGRTGGVMIMKLFKKISLMMVLVMIGMTLMVGCGGNAQKEEPSTQKDTESTETQAQAKDDQD